MKLLREFLQSIPIWICLLGLDLDFWTEEATGCVGSKIGNPIKLDQVTKGMIRISFAWVLIEIDSKCSFPNQIPILDENDNLICNQLYMSGYLTNAKISTMMVILKQMQHSSQMGTKTIINI